MKRNFVLIGWLTLILAIGTLSELAAPSVRILPLGDSITEGCCLPIGGGYRITLYALLTEAGYNVDFVGTLQDANPSPALLDIDHEGHDGFRIDEIDNGIGSWLGGIDDPDVVLLHIGSNDSVQNFQMSTAPNRLENLIDHLAAQYPHAKIIVASIIVAADPAVENRVTNYNSFIPGIVSSEAFLGRQVSFVDLHACCDVTDLSDPVAGLHPTEDGYAKMATNWYPAISSVISPFGTTNAPAIMRTRGQVDLQHVVIEFSKPLDDTSATAIGNYSVSDGVSVVRATLDSSKRTVTLATTPQTTNTIYHLTVSALKDRTAQLNEIASGTVVSFQSGSIPEAINYSLIYSLRIPNWASYNTDGVPYEIDRHSSIGSFSRVAYYLELQPNGGAPLQYIWVSMNAFTNDAGKLGVPTVQSGAFFQQMLTNMSVRANVPGVVSGDGLSGGNIEYWWGNYGKSNAGNVPHASSSVYDWGDSASPTDPGGYGSMQLHNSEASQTLFAFNGWGNGSFDSSAADLGIGNAPGLNTDWTQAFNATNYTSRRLLQVYVMPVNVLAVDATPNSGVPVTVNPIDTVGAGAGSTPLTRSYFAGSLVNLAVPLVSGTNTFDHWQQDGITIAASTNVSVSLDGDHALTAVYAPTRTLTVNSSPSVGVAVAVTPVDNASLGSGVTPFSRSFVDGTHVNLTVAFVSAFGTFSNWQEDGLAFATTTNVAVVLGANHVFTALYVPTRTLTVASTPNSGVFTTVSPIDINGAGSGPTRLTRIFPDGTTVNLAAPLVVGTNTFSSWQQDGVTVSLTTNVSVTLAADHALTAVYMPTRILTVTSSNPGSGVTVLVNGTNGQIHVTDFVSSFPDGTNITLEAPPTVGLRTFSKWLEDGIELTTSTNVNVAITGDHVFTAVYVSTLLAEYIFYNNSAWDKNDPNANTNDDLAIAIDKLPLHRGEIGTFTNYTSYGNGINGIMVDMSTLLGTLTTNDFVFKVGNDNNPGTWPLAPAPTILAVRVGAGMSGSDRVTLIWADRAIRGQWLEVTVLATGNTGLANPVIFYFGNAVGESGNSTTEARVNVIDENATRIHARTFVNPAPIDDRYDYNRDQRVNVLDENLARINGTTFLTALRLIDLSAF